jgi:hypothetical protein
LNVHSLNAKEHDDNWSLEVTRYMARTFFWLQEGRMCSQRLWRWKLLLLFFFSLEDVKKKKTAKEEVKCVEDEDINENTEGKIK